MGPCPVGDAKTPMRPVRPTPVAGRLGLRVGQGWTRPELSAKERSLITVACLTTSGNTDQLVFHLDYARRNGNTEAELIEAITHVAFYAGWPKAMSGMAVAKQVFANKA